MSPKQVLIQVTSGALPEWSLPDSKQEATSAFSYGVKETATFSLLEGYIFSIRRNRTMVVWVDVL